MRRSKLVIMVLLLQIGIIAYLSYSIHQKKNVQGIVSVNPISKEDTSLNEESNLRFFYEPKPNSIDPNNIWIPYKAVYTINADTLNERFDYSVDKPSDVYRIITLGDSFVYGLYVDTQDNWPEKLEEQLKQCTTGKSFEVINLGMRGYDIQYAVERFRIRGMKYDPDLVLWMVRNEDLTQLNEVTLEKERKYSKEMKETGEFDELVRAGSPYPSWSRAFGETIDTIGTEEIIRLQNEFIDEFTGLYSGELVLITFPFTKNQVKEEYKSIVNRRQNSYYFEDLPDIYHDMDLYLIDDGHPSQEGHKQIAESIYNYLQSANIIDCN